jgi:retron-type reverse transcriptase
MGLFDWIKEIFFGGLPEKKPQIVRPPASRPAPPPVRPPPAGFTPSRPPVPAPAPVPRPQASYDAADFLPISDRELRKQAATSEVANSPWWGRTDTIPPGDDARTKLIDRALVTRGYLTPEQLAEIHRVGDLMLLHKGDEAMLRQEAARAVQRSKGERAALKAQKKAEAEARGQKRAAAVAFRKANEIDFLGRGVSKGLADRRSNVEKLEKAGLPVLSGPADVARAMGLPVPQLRWLAFHSEASTTSHYVRFRIPKKSGGTREISAPMPKIAAAQQWILANVLSKLPSEPPAHGFIPGRSTVTNATPHVKRAVVVNLDLKDFFPSISFPRVQGLFQALGYSPAVATVFALLSTEAPRKEVEYEGRKYHVALGPRGLPQGACTSPAISNLAARILDRRLGGLAAKLGWTYTRYADDLTFSGDTQGNPTPRPAAGASADRPKDPRSVAWLIARTRHLCEDEGFEVNEKKLRVQRRNTTQSVTGIVVNEKPSTPRKERRRLRAILHRAKFEGLEKQNRIQHPHFRAYVAGHVAYVSMVNPAQGATLKAKLDALK